MSETKKGIINNLNSKGFGFIRPTESKEDKEEKDIFFHASRIVDVRFDSLEPGMSVCYVVEEGKKGPMAVDIVIDYFGYADKELRMKMYKDKPNKEKRKKKEPVPDESIED